MQQISSSGSNNPQRRPRGFSWKYDEDHHIGEYSVENALLPIDDNAHPSEYEYEYEFDHDLYPSEYEFEYEYEYDDSETNQENNEMDFCEPGLVTDDHQTAELSSALSNNNNNQQQQQQQESADPQYDASRRRRRRPLRKVLGKAWEIPSQTVMQRRNRFRRIVHDETRRHRRILPHGNNDRAGVGSGTNANTNNTRADAKPKNVLELLRDREVFGGGSSSSNKNKNSGIETNGVGGGRSSGFRVGVSIATPAESQDDGAAGHKRRRRRKKRHRNAASTQRPMPSATDATTTDYAATVSETSPTTTTNRRWNSRSQRHTTDELRTFAEHACVTKFESSYLSHLQHDEVEKETGANETSNGNGENNENSNNGNDATNANANQQQQQQQNTSSKAVSTISIAFSPDGKTMASTHGDHTVKITCCMTGKLLQTLVGHPRTPWTVKYHPHAGANHNQNSKKKRVIIANSTSTTSNSNNNINSSSNTSGAASRPVSGLLAALREASSKQQQQQEEQQQQQQIVASGCLGHQVRIWDWISGTCLQMIRLEFPIISLSFHPSGSVLAIANGTRLHFWGLPTVTQAKDETATANNPTTDTTTEGGSSTVGTTSENGNSNNNGSSSSSSSSSSSRIVTNPSQGMHIEMRHMLRCVHFLPDGKKVIVGGVNPQTSAEIRRLRRLATEGNQENVPTMSFYLRLWDFDLDAAKGVHSASESDRRQAAAAHVRQQGTAERSTSGIGSSSNNNNSNNSNMTRQQTILESSRAAAAAAAVANNMAATTRRRRAISNPRCFVPRALLYNDGGFDVSPDGKTLCACAEYWLPEGVGNATDLLHPPDKDDDDDDDFDYGSGDDSSSEEEGKSHCSDNDENDVKMDVASDEEEDKNQLSPKQSPSKAEKDAADTTASFGGVASADAKESNSSKEKSAEDSKRKARNPPTSASNVSPTRPQSSSSSIPSATPPRISGRQPRQIASPPLAAAGATAGTMLNVSATYGLPLPPIHAGVTPQTPPPNVNPLNFPLSPPSPPGRRFAGGLSRGPQQSSEQHEQLLQQYNRQQAMLHQQRHNQQQQDMPPPQHQRGGSTYTPANRGTENGTTTIPAPPGINHRNHRQHRLHTQQSSGSGLQKAGNPFVTTSRSSRGVNAQRGRFVPHVVTISLDTEPYVDTVIEEVAVGSVGSSLVASDTAMMTSHQQSGSSRIRSTTVAATSSVNANSTVTKTTYNVPGRLAALGATFPHVLERRPRLGQLLSACPLDRAKASAVTCVKYSPCTDFCLIGYGVREPHVEEVNDETNDPPMHPPYHPVTAMYKVNKGGAMRHVSTMLSGDDDVNIARFHPDSGYGFVYGTKQGRIRILGPRPWNYYNC